jgi:hypothetical protein
MSRSRIISLVVSFIYIIALIKHPAILFKLVAYLIMPLACIWFPEEMGSYTNESLPLNYLTKATPAFFVALGGWILMLLPTIIVLIVLFSH